MVVGSNQVEEEGKDDLRSTGTITRRDSMNKAKRKRRLVRRPVQKPRLVCPPEVQQLRTRCLAPVSAFFGVGELTHTSGGPLIFQDNDSDILAVAHLDTVRQDRHFGVYREDSDTLLNCQLDDRLGAWIILDALPARGIVLDILLTTGEELCNSTAKHFATNKRYNWIVEFDRSGTDVVTYQYTNQDWINALKASGNDIGYGSYSDIAELGHLGASAANWGVGYYNNHNLDSYCSISELGDTLKRFERFHKENYATRYDHVPVTDWWEQNDYEDHASDCRCLECRDTYGCNYDQEWDDYHATRKQNEANG